jgi:hypothetical protein
MKIIEKPISTFEGLVYMCNHNTEKFVHKFNKQTKTTRNLTAAVLVLAFALGMTTKRLDEQDKKIDELVKKLETKTEEQKETVECD